MRGIDAAPARDPHAGVTVEPLRGGFLAVDRALHRRHVGELQARIGAAVGRNEAANRQDEQEHQGDGALSSFAHQGCPLTVTMDHPASQRVGGTIAL